MEVVSNTILFGGAKGWSASDWTDSDDRVRGGRSRSHMQISNTTATFCGNLDIKTLGGAGFASQRTTGDDRSWDLSRFDGIVLSLDPSKSDEKTYTFILKDEILPLNPDNGREQSTTSWEYDFRIPDSSTSSDRDKTEEIRIKWDEFQPTYRGKKQNPSQPLQKDKVKRMSIMMRSFFGTQEGDFRLCLHEVGAFKSSDKVLEEQRIREDDALSSNSDCSQEDKHGLGKNLNKTLWARILDCCRL